MAKLSAGNRAQRARKTQRVAVTGATGTVGQFVVKRLLAEGMTVRATSSQAPTTHSEPSEGEKNGLEPYLFDLSKAAEPGYTKTLLTDCDALVHCAFAHEPGRYRGGEGQDPQTFWTVNLGATAQLLNACAVLGISRAVIMSSRAVFGATQEVTVSDTSPTAPDTHYGALKRAEESLVRISSRQGKLDAACLRATGVYGALNNPAESKWFDHCQQVTAQRPITAVRAGTEVHGDDVADAVWRLLRAPKGTLRGEAFNCSDQWVSTRMIARQLNSMLAAPLTLPEFSPTPAGQAKITGVMRCEGLHKLGWRPGGRKRLAETLQTLLGQA